MQGDCIEKQETRKFWIIGANALKFWATAQKNKKSENYGSLEQINALKFRATAQKTKKSEIFGSLEQMLKFRATAERHTTCLCTMQ